MKNELLNLYRWIAFIFGPFLMGACLVRMSMGVVDPMLGVGASAGVLMTIHSWLL